MLACLCAMACGALPAAPAPWFEWRSKIDGALVCTQTTPGPGWDKARGPFSDSHCGKWAHAK